MRALMLSLDKKILEKDSGVQRRLIALAEKAGALTVFVPDEREAEERVSEHLIVYSFGGPKWLQLLKLWMGGEKILNPSSDSEVGVLPLEKGELRFDLITVQDTSYLALLGCFLSRKFSVPFEVQVHGFEKMRGIRGRLARFVLERATRVRAVSERLRRELDSRFKIQDSRVYTLPVYTQICERGEKGEMGRRGKRVPYPFIFLTVGRLVPVKNIGLQIRAFARLANEVSQVRLRIVGDGPEVTNLKIKVQNERLEDKIFFEGYQKDLGEYYEEADAFLLTSDAEGWGLVALEAAAHKLPVIMTNVGLANEVLHHDKECIVVPVGDEAHLVGAMKEVLDHPELRERLGEAAFAAFKKLPSKDEQIQRQVTEWHSLLNLDF